MQKIQKIQLNISKIFRNKGFFIKESIFSLILLGSLIFGNSVFAQEAKGDINYFDIEKEIINQLNQERRENNLSSLRFNPELREAAEIKLKDLVENEYFSHTSPEGIKAWDILTEIGYDYKYAGENLAMKFYNAVDVHNAWMKSKTHRENILFEEYTDVAVAIGKRAKGSLVAVEFFGKPASSSIMGRVVESAGIEKSVVGNKIVNSKKEYESILMEAQPFRGSMNELTTQIIPNKKLAEGRSSEKIVFANLSPEQMMSFNNMALLVVGIVCLILVVNIWVLEKEDERVIAEAKRLCVTKQGIANV